MDVLSAGAGMYFNQRSFQRVGETDKAGKLSKDSAKLKTIDRNYIVELVQDDERGVLIKH